MFDIHTLKATPANARRVVYLNKFKRLELPPAIESLAHQDVITEVPGFSLTPEQLASVQYLRDWNYRGVLLHDDIGEARTVGLAAASLIDRSPVVVVTRLQNYDAWVAAIRLITNEPILLLTNPRYGNPTVNDPNTTVSEKPVDGFKWIVTSYGCLIYHDVVTKPVPGIMLIDELEDQQAVNYKWSDSVRGMLREVPRCIAIQSVRPLSTIHGADALTCLKSATRGYESHLRWWMADALNLVTPSVVMGIMSNTFHTQMAEAGYVDFDAVDALPCAGVNLDLVYAASKVTSLSFADHSFTDALQLSSNMARHMEIEQEVTDRTGMSLTTLLSKAVKGDASAIQESTRLKTPKWAFYKHRFIHSTANAVLSRSNRAIVYARHPDLIRQFRLQQSELEDLSTTNNPNSAIARYLHPHHTWRKYMQSDVPAPTNMLMLSRLEHLNQDVIDVADYFFLAEWPDTREEYELIVELCNQGSMRLAHFTLEGTFESITKALLTD